MRALWLVVLVAGCWTQATPAPVVPAPATTGVYRPPRSVVTLAQRCATSIGTAFDVASDELEKTGMSKQVIEEFQEVLVESCEVTVWADEILDCVASITGAADWNPCQNRMTAEQKDDWTKRAIEIMQRRRHSSGGATP
jgi:hypothetical protein